MRKIIVSGISAALLAVPLVGLALITEITGPPEDVTVLDILDSITDWAFTILLIVAAIFIIVAGYFFVTAQGDPEKTKKARDFVLYALIGVLVGFAAKALVYLVEQIVTG